MTLTQMGLLGLASTYVYLNIKQARVTWHVAKKLKTLGFFPKAPNRFLDWATPAISFVSFTAVYATLTWIIDLISGVLTFSLFEQVSVEEMDRMADDIYSTHAGK